MWLEGFQVAGANVAWLVLGSLVGLVVGILPAVGPSFGVALMLPFTFALDPAAALIFLCAIQAACAYGDSIASILLNVPGGPGTVASCWDGHPLSRQGKAGTALGIATAASFVGGVISWLSFVALAGPMTRFALSIGPPEYFVLGLMALCLVSVASKGETLKGLIMACLGLAISCIGPDPVTGMTYRFSFGLRTLEPGIEIVLGALAIFAIPQVVDMLEEGGAIAQVTQVKDSVLRGVWEVVRRPLTVLRAGVVGWVIGVMPAFGTSLAGITSYLVEKRYARDSGEFGKGSPTGLVAAEVGKGACVLGDGIPSLMLGVPGSVTWAILMAALILHGVQPGPRFMTSGVLPYAVFAGLLLGQLAYFVLGLAFVRYLARLVYVPNAILAPVVAVLCFLGAFVAKNYVYDIAIMVAFGTLALAAQRSGYPTVCMILGFILGPIVEANFHRALGVGFGSYSVFVSRPISVALLAVTVLFLAWPYLSEIARHRRGTRMAVDRRDEGTRAPEVRCEELAFVGVVVALFAAFAVAGLGYKPEVRLFPMLVSGVGLVLSIYRGAGAVWGKRLQPLRWVVVPPFGGRLPWWYTVPLLFVYAFLVPVLGFVAASVLWLVSVVLLVGYRRFGVVAVSAVGLVMFLVGFARLLHVILPAGILG
jgi:putative tricarboxylic transport membrane protein